MHTLVTPPTALHTGGPPHVIGNIVGFHGRLTRKLAETRLGSASSAVVGDYIIRESTNAPPVSDSQDARVCILHTYGAHTPTNTHTITNVRMYIKYVRTCSSLSITKVGMDAVHHWELGNQGYAVFNGSIDISLIHTYHHHRFHLCKYTYQHHHTVPVPLCACVCVYLGT